MGADASIPPVAIPAAAPKGAPVAASIRFFPENVSGNPLFMGPAWRPYGVLSQPQPELSADARGPCRPHKERKDTGEDIFLGFFMLLV